MNQWQRRGIFVVVGILIIVGIYFLIGWGSRFGQQSKNESEKATPIYGVVNMDTLIKLNPKYDKYETLQKDYSNLQAQYVAEQKILTEKAKVQSEELKKAGSDAALLNSLDAEYKAKMTIKEQELNARLNESYKKFLQENGQTDTKPANNPELRIVNLQLQLQALSLPDAEKKEKEAELHQLLAQKESSLLANNTFLQGKIDNLMAPLKASAKAELEAYGEQLISELKAKRDAISQEREATIIAQNGLPVPAAWNQEWETKLSAKQEEMKSAENDIVEDIRQRVATIAKEKNLVLVVTKTESSNQVIDLTDAVIATYR